MTTYQRILAVTINPGLAIVGTLPAVTYNVSYSATLQGYGGVEPYQWSIVSGALPTGLSATTDSNGDFVISGTTTDIGDHALVIMLEDSAGRSVARRFNLRVIALPLVISGHAPDGEVGTAYTFTYTVSGGLAPYSFFVASGSLPSGLSLNASTGTISGTPTAVQSTAFTIQVRDSQSPYASANQYDTVNVQADLLQVSGTFATPVNNGDPLTGSLTITGGVSPYSVSVYSGTAPPGVTFSVSGSSVVASGNTTTDGSYSWTLRVTSTDGQHADSAQSVTVESAPSWEDVVSGLSPLYWMKLNEANTAAVEASGNFGSAGGTVDVIEDSGFPTFGEASLIPSEPTRSTCENGAGNARIIMYGGIGAAQPNAAATIYFIYAGTTGNSAQVAWRDGSGSGNWFARFDGTNVRLRIRNVDLTTTYANSNIKDGNAHLIGVCVTSTDASLWVDGVEVWTGSCGGSSTAANGWTYTQNGSFSNQKLYGSFGDFLVWNRTLTDTENEDLYAAFSGT